MRRSVVASVLVGASASTATAQPLDPAVTPAASGDDAPRPFVPNRRGTNRWEGSLLAAAVGANLHWFNPSPLLTHIPAVAVNLTLLPRFWLGRGFQLRADLSLSRTFYDADTTTTRPGVRFSDPWLALWFHGIPSFADFHPAVSVGLGFPMSEESQARTLLLSTSVSGQLAWWRRVSSVTLFARLSFGWQHQFYEYTTPGVRTSPSSAICSGSGCDAIVGYMSITDYFSASLTLAPRWRYFSPGTSFRYTVARAASLATSTYGGSAEKTHAFSTFAVWLEFIPTPPVSLLLSYNVSRSVLDADGTYGNPFYAPNHDTAVWFTVALRVDEIAALLRHERTGPGGVVRW